MKQRTYVDADKLRLCVVLEDETERCTWAVLHLTREQVLVRQEFEAPGLTLEECLEKAAEAADKVGLAQFITPRSPEVKRFSDYLHKA